MFLFFPVVEKRHDLVSNFLGQIVLQNFLQTDRWTGRQTMLVPEALLKIMTRGLNAAELGESWYYCCKEKNILIFSWFPYLWIINYSFCARSQQFTDTKYIKVSTNITLTISIRVVILLSKVS